jgi:Predicted integral membrane protein
MQSWRNTLLNSGDKRKLAVFTALTLLWMIVIFLFSAQPSEESYKTSDLVLAFQQKYFDTFFDKLTPIFIRKAAHMAEFGLLAMLYLAVLKSGGDAFFKRKTKINHYLISLMAASLYAFTDELHQFFVPGRNATVLDWLFDSFGALAVLWIVHTISAKIKKKKSTRGVFP